MKNTDSNFVVVYHGLLKKYKLSLTEYMVMDVITRLATYSKNPHRGWYFGNRKYLVNRTGTSIPTIARIYKKLEEKGLIARHSDPRKNNWLKPICQEWIDTVELGYNASYDDVFEDMQYQVDTADVGKQYQSDTGGDEGQYQNDTDIYNSSTDINNKELYIKHAERSSAGQNERKIEIKKKAGKKKHEVLDSSSSSLIPEIIKNFAERINPACATHYGNKTQRQATQFLLDTYGFENVMKMIDLIEATRQLEYQHFRPSINTPWELKEKWSKMIDALTRERSKNMENSPDVVI